MEIKIPVTALILISSLLTPSVYAQKNTNITQSEQEGRNAYFQQEYASACRQKLVTWNSLPSTPDEAAQQEVTFESRLGYRTQLNSQGTGYVQLAITEWNEKLVIYHNEDIQLELPGGDVTGSSIKNLQCPHQGKLITHFNTHEWGSYTLKLAGKPNQKVEFSIVKEVKR